MKLKGIFVLVVGMAMFPMCSAEIGPNDLWKFDSPMNFVPGSEIDVDYLEIWTTNSPMQFVLGDEIDEGINLKSGIDEGINLKSGIDKGFTINPEFAAKIGAN